VARLVLGLAFLHIVHIRRMIQAVVFDTARLNGCQRLKIPYQCLQLLALPALGPTIMTFRLAAGGTAAQIAVCRCGLSVRHHEIAVL